MFSINKLAGAALLMAAMASAAAQGPLGVELNRLEPIQDGCRAYLVFQNPAERRYASLRLDLVIFDRNDVIARRMALEAAPLRPRKTTVKVFDLSGLECPQVGRILLNDVLACADEGDEADAPPGDCLDQLSLSSRASVEFVK